MIMIKQGVGDTKTLNGFVIMNNPISLAYLVHKSVVELSLEMYLIKKYSHKAALYLGDGTDGHCMMPDYCPKIN